MSSEKKESELSLVATLCLVCKKKVEGQGCFEIELHTGHYEDRDVYPELMHVVLLKVKKEVFEKFQIGHVYELPVLFSPKLSRLDVGQKLDTNKS